MGVAYMEFAHSVPALNNGLPSTIRLLVYLLTATQECDITKYVLNTGQCRHTSSLVVLVPYSSESLKNVVAPPTLRFAQVYLF